MHTVALHLRAGSARGAKAGKDQKAFNRLVKEVDALRAALAHWQACLPALQQRVATEIEPLLARYREQRVALVMLLHAAIQGTALSKRQSTKATEILRAHLSEILAEAPDDQLLALHDQYAETSFAEEQAIDAELERSMAESVFGVAFDEDLSALSEEELARVIAENISEDDLPRRGRARGRAAPDKPGKAKSAAALREQLAQGASAAVREIYRKLASELHPDREPDLDERTRKTALMQQANQAYAVSDLLTLLGLQLQLKQIDDTTLQTLARERLTQFNYLLDEQCRQLRHEIDAVTMPFAMNLSLRVHDLTPEAIEQALKREARDLKRAARECAADVAHFRDIRQIKQALNDYRLGDVNPDFLRPLDEALFDDVPRTRRRRSR